MYVNTMSTLEARSYIIQIYVYPLVVLTRYRDPQLQVGKNYLYVYTLNYNIL